MALYRRSKSHKLATVDLEIEVNPELIERRRHVRAIPCPIAEECVDEQTWSDWMSLSGLSPLGSDAEEPKPSDPWSSTVW